MLEVGQICGIIFNVFVAGCISLGGTKTAYMCSLVLISCCFFPIGTKVL